MLIKNRAEIAILTAALALAPLLAAAQTYPPSQLLPSTRMNILYEANPGGHDYMTTGGYLEATRYPGLGQSFYIPSAAGSGPPLYRLFNGVNDHMVSLLAGEGGYATEFVLGFPYAYPGLPQSPPGLRQIGRFVNSTDHATYVHGLPIGGYTEEGGLGVYGYQRWFNNATYPHTWSAGEITETSDLVAGGAVSAWTWNGIQFINTNDYGRYMQADFFFQDPGRNNIYPYNPIEAGENIYIDPFNKALGYVRRGSPILVDQVVNGQHITRAAPIEYFGTYIDSDVDHLRIYTGAIIGKDLTLNWNGMGKVAQYLTHLYVPVAIDLVDAEVPTAYLTSEFTNFYTFDGIVRSNVTDQVVSSCDGGPPGIKYYPPNGRGGVIISRADGTAAMGVYGITRAGGGKLDHFTLHNFLTCGATSKWGARMDKAGLVAGDNVFEAYIVTGTRCDIEMNMQILAYVETSARKCSVEP